MGVDYIVRDGVIELVDEFTGRVADKRRWPDGLQAALEAKENINTNPISGKYFKFNYSAAFFKELFKTMWNDSYCSISRGRVP